MSRSIRPFVQIAFVLGIWLVFLAPSSSHADDDLHYFEFALHGHPASEHFIAGTSDSALLATIQQQLALPEDQRFLHVNGPIEVGVGGHNAPWTWHFVPDDWRLAEMSIEVCDGTPSMVQGDLDYWLNNLGHFCPWSSYVLRATEPRCCLGDRGNADGDPYDQFTLGDLTALIDHLFVSFEPLDCWEEANLDFSQPEGPGSISLGDLTAMILYMFVLLSPPPSCP